MKDKESLEFFHMQKLIVYDFSWQMSHANR